MVYSVSQDYAFGKAYFLSTTFLGNNHTCDLPCQDGLVNNASKDGTVILSDNLDALVDMRHKMPSGNNTAVNVFLNFPDLSQIPKSTGNNKSTVGNFHYSAPVTKK